MFTSTKLISIEGEEKVEKVVIDQIDISCDLVIFAIGMKPEVGFAKKSGIKIGKFGGLRVNNQMQTNITDIYAWGDCVEIFDKKKNSHKTLCHGQWLSCKVKLQHLIVAVLKNISK